MIEVNHLVKKYGDQTAVSDLSFTIEKGHIYGFLGPNGAGKSTTMNIMTGCLAATSGEVKIGGFDIFEEPKKAKKLIGYLPEIPPLYMEQTPREYLHFVARAKGVARGTLEDEIDRAIMVTHIENVADKMIRHLSKGYRQRVGIAQAILGNPEVIILDEPTVGLDPVQIIEIRDLIKELGKTHTVILSSHILSEVQAVCEEVLIIHKGKLIAYDKPENLSKALSQGMSIELLADGTAAMTERTIRSVMSEIAAEGDEKATRIKEIGAVKEVDGRSALTLSLEGEDAESVCRRLFFAFAKAGIAILTMKPAKATLEDIFIELTNSEEEIRQARDEVEEQDEDDYEDYDDEDAEEEESSSESGTGEKEA